MNELEKLFALYLIYNAKGELIQLDQSEIGEDLMEELNTLINNKVKIAVANALSTKDAGK